MLRQLWLALVVFAGCGAPSFAQLLSSDASATNCAVAISGDAHTSSITNVCGISDDTLKGIVQAFSESLATASQLDAQRIKEIETLRVALDLTQGQIRSALTVLGETAVPAQMLGDKLVEIATKYQELRTLSVQTSGSFPSLDVLRDQAQAAVDAGRLTEADAILSQIETELDNGQAEIAARRASVAAGRGTIALAGLRYEDAADEFAKAVRLLPEGQAFWPQRLSYLHNEARALFIFGEEFGAPWAIEQAAERYRRIGELTRTDHQEWARSQHSLANTLQVLGEFEPGVARSYEAVAAFEAVLKTVDRQVTPVAWASLKADLGNALQVIGKRSPESHALEDAVAAYRVALEVYQRDAMPRDWAGIKNNLGSALLALGERGEGTVLLEEAVSTLRDALQVQSLEVVPQEWARTQSNLSEALLVLGERTDSIDLIEQSVAAAEAALRHRTREESPLNWAWSRIAFGNALLELGRRQSSIGVLERAVQAYRDALLIWGPERNDPGDFALMLGALDEGLALLGDELIATGWDDEPRHLRRAIEVYGELFYRRPGQSGQQQEVRSLNRLAVAWARLAELDPSTENFNEAATAYGMVVAQTPNDRSLNWALVNYQYGVVLLGAADYSSDLRLLEAAMAAFRAAFGILTVEQYPERHPWVIYRMQRCLELLQRLVGMQLLSLDDIAG